MTLEKLGPHKRAFLPFLRSAALGAALLFAQPAFGQVEEEELPIPPETNDDLNDTVQAAVGPENEWNCLDIAIAEVGIRAITPNYKHGDQKAIERIRMLTKSLVPATVLASNGQIHAWLRDGTLHGVEFHIFENDPGHKPHDEEVLGVVGAIYGYDLDGVWRQVGKLFCYDQALYAARIQLLTVMMDGMAPSQHRIWLGNALQAEAVPGVPVCLLGESNVVYGGVKSNGGLRIGGNNHVAPDSLRHRRNVVIYGDGHDLGTLVREEPSSAEPAPHGRPWYRSRAVENGTYFGGDLVIVANADGEPVSTSGVRLSGVVYSAGDIDVEGTRMAGNLTLVAEGQVLLTGSGMKLTAAVDDVLAHTFSREAGIAIDGSGNFLIGSFLAPRGGFRMAGSTNLVRGRTVARTAMITGSQNELSDGTR